ncbi:MAG: Uma2 family endonuclease [Chloroflexi bacterium]|nr:Uma2 family endonuclease [Chloroflexota bacterium]
MPAQESNARWAQVVSNPLLRDLPFKIELNKFGQLLMRPASNKHGNAEYEIGRAIERGRKGGKIIMECSIQTSDGVKVADVAWANDAFIAKYGYDTPYPRAPELCVEVVSPSNSEEELQYKSELYLAKGATEVWVVDEDKRVRYFNAIGEITKSELVKRLRF